MSRKRASIRRVQHLHQGRRYICDHQMNAHGAKEYVRGIVHTNTIGLLLRVQARHEGRLPAALRQAALPPLLAEFDFRYNNRVKLGVNESRGQSAHYLVSWASAWTYRSVGQLV